MQNSRYKIVNEFRQQRDTDFRNKKGSSNTSEETLYYQKLKNFTNEIQIIKGANMFSDQ